MAIFKAIEENTLLTQPGCGRCFGNGLKRIPSRTRREFKVADVIAEPKPEAGSDRHNDYIFITGCKRRHAKTCHHISATSDSIKLFVDRVGARKVVCCGISGHCERGAGCLPFDPPQTWFHHDPLQLLRESIAKISSRRIWQSAP